MQEHLENTEELQIDLIELFQVIMKKAWAVVLCMVIAAGIAGGYTKFLVTPMYSASSSIYILGTSAEIGGINLTLSNQLATDFMVLAKSRPVIENVIEELHLDMNYDQLSASVTVENPGGTSILKTTVVNADPKLAKDISNAMSNAVAERIAEVMDMEKPNIVEQAVTPKAPSSPNLRKNVLLGGLIGAALMIGVLVLLYLLDDTIKDEEDVKKYLGLDTLAMFPEGRKRGRG